MCGSGGNYGVWSRQHCSLKLFALLNSVAPSLEVSCPVSPPCRTLFLWSSGGIQGWCTVDHTALCFHPYLDATLSGHCNRRGFRRPESVLCLCGGQPRGRALGTLMGDASLLAQLSLGTRAPCPEGPLWYCTSSIRMSSQEACAWPYPSQSSEGPSLPPFSHTLQW